MKKDILDFYENPIISIAVTIIVFVVVYKCLITLYKALSYYNEREESDEINNNLK